MDVQPQGKALIADHIGATEPLADVSLQDVISKVPATRLPHHPLIDTSEEQRVRHARGQSFPDWLAMRSGDFVVFPDGVAFPESSEQVRELLDFAVAEDIVVIPYGGGTSVAGHITPNESDKPILTIAMGHMNQLLDLDEVSQIATFGAGIPGPQVEAQLQARGYTLGHFPQSFELSTLGGWVASRSSGQQSLRYGRIEQMFAGGRMETLLGTLDIPSIPASSAGPDLREMTMGTEGRMGIFTEIKVRVTRVAQQEVFFVYFMPDWQSARSVAREAVQQSIPMSMMRLSNAVETRTHLHLGTTPEKRQWLNRYLTLRGLNDDKCMLTFGLTGSRYQNVTSMKQLRKILSTHRGVGGMLANMMGRIWSHGRFRFPYLRESLWHNGVAVDTLETATDWPNVDQLIKEIESAIAHALEDEGERVMVFTHLSHLYSQGSSIYTTYFFRCADDYPRTLARWSKIKAAASQVIARGHATISHQHGVGKDHATYLHAEKGTLGMRSIRSVLDAFDPDERMNPGVLLEESLQKNRK
jgi:alkyldihydroxyacetonephosphate synthase